MSPHKHERHDEVLPGRCKKCGEIINMLEVAADADKKCPKCKESRPGFELVF